MWSTSFLALPWLIVSFWGSDSWSSMLYMIPGRSSSPEAGTPGVRSAVFGLAPQPVSSGRVATV